MMKISQSFYQRDDTLLIARELLGKYLFTKVEDKVVGGIIVETEAYLGPEDRGSHSFNNKRTTRNEMMYEAGGVVYMYICYGIHDRLNIVTGTKGSSHAILIRALEPVAGIDTMKMRRGSSVDRIRLCKGPGALGKALGVSKLHNGVSLQGDEVWIEDQGLSISDDDVVSTARVGMNFDGVYKEIPWRYYIKGNKYVSRR